MVDRDSHVLTPLEVRELREAFEDLFAELDGNSEIAWMIESLPRLKEAAKIVGVISDEE